MDLFEDIPDDLESMPIDDLFFSDYLENLLDPSVSSAGAFSSDNQQIEGASPSYSATHSSSNNQSRSFDPQTTASHGAGTPRQSSDGPATTSASYGPTSSGGPFSDISQPPQSWPIDYQASAATGGASQPLPPVISLTGYPSQDLMQPRGSLDIALSPLESMDMPLPLPQYNMQVMPGANQPLLPTQPMGFGAWTAMNPNPEPNQYGLPQDPSFQQPYWGANTLPPALGAEQMPPAQPPLGYFAGGSDSFPAQPPGQAGQAFTTLMQERANPAGMTRHRERSGSQEGGNSFGHVKEVSEGSAGQANSGNAGFPSIPNAGNDGMNFTGGAGQDGEGEAPKKGGRRNRNRTEHQQNLNKLAQQRYRERKKQKALETEQAAAQLASKMDAFNLVKERYRQLSEENEALQASLNKTDTELVQLHRERAAVPAAERQEETHTQDESNATGRIMSALDMQSQQLRAALTNCGGNSPEAALRDPAAVPREMLTALEGLVESINAHFLRLQCLEGVDVLQSYAAFSQGKACPAGCTCYFCQQKAAGGDFASGLCLSREQRRKIEYVRDDYVKKLQGIYAERQKLNMEAIRVLLPQGTGQQVQAGKYGFLGFFQRAKQGASVTAVLDNLKENLRLEQRASAEVDFMTFKRILTPVQGGHFILSSYPAKADAVGLGKAVKDQSAV